MRRIILIALVSAAIVSNGCLSAQVAEKARSADQLVDGLEKALKALVDFDDEAKSDSEKLHIELRQSLDELASAMQVAKWTVVAEAHRRLCEVERRAAYAVETAKIRAKALREAKEQAVAAKSATAATAALAEANAAQYQAFAGIGKAIMSGLGGPNITPSIPGADYTGEIITGGVSILLAFLGIQGKRLFKRPPAPVPVYRGYNTANSNGARPGPLAPPQGSGNIATAEPVPDPALMAAWKASQGEA